MIATKIREYSIELLNVALINNEISNSEQLIKKGIIDVITNGICTGGGTMEESGKVIYKVLERISFNYLIISGTI